MVNDWQNLGWVDLVAQLPEPELSPEVEATTYLGAAIHTAHRLLPVQPLLHEPDLR